MAWPLHDRLGLGLLLGVLLASGAGAQTALPPEEGRTLGRRVADAEFVDENGRSFELRSLRGKPLLVSPIFTRCPHTCPMITASLKAAVAGVGPAGEDFNVLSLTFDASDSEADLRSYRQKMGLPARWLLARAPNEQLLPFLESLDFRFISNADGSFTHPNLVAVLTPDLAVAKYLYGTEYRADDLRGALEVARGRGALLDSLAPYVFLVGVLGALISAGVVLFTWRRASGRAVGEG